MQKTFGILAHLLEHLGLTRGLSCNPYATEFKSDDTTATISTITGLKAGRTFIHLHEFGSNDDGSAMNTHIESGDVDIADGDSLCLLVEWIPDFKSQSGIVDLTIKTRPYPTGTQDLHTDHLI